MNKEKLEGILETLKKSQRLNIENFAAVNTQIVLEIKILEALLEEPGKGK